MGLLLDVPLLLLINIWNFCPSSILLVTVICCQLLDVTEVTLWFETITSSDREIKLTSQVVSGE